MNNDISSELTNYINTRTSHAAKKTNNTPAAKDEKTVSVESYEVAQKCYDAMGHAKVSMDNGINNRIADSLDVLKKDPEYVQNHIAFCDDLQEKGYSLEDAVIGTDIIFDTLKDEAIYRP